MELSRGLATITAPGASRPSAYIWPVYGDKRPVDPIRQVLRDDYERPEPKRADKASAAEIIRAAQSVEAPVYTARLELRSLAGAGIAPGSLFDALA
jgi:hypothetical protein